MHVYQGIEKRRERWQNEARKDEKAEFAVANEHFESFRNAVMPSA